MLPTTRDVYRKKLLALRDRLCGTLVRLETEAPLATDTPLHADVEPGDRGDASVGVYEETVNLALVHNEENLLEEVNAAIERLDVGGFGTCERCGVPISGGRLSATPYSRHCIACASMAEGEDGRP